MFESISCDIPMPTWTLRLDLISAPPSRSSSQVDGPFGSPTSVHMLLR